MKKFFDSYLNVSLFVTVSILLLSVTFTLITGMSPLEALNVKPLAATMIFAGLIILFIVVPLSINRLRERE